jgi:hypothetical protein
LKDVDPSVHKDVMEGRTDGSVIISLRNFVGDRIIKQQWTIEEISIFSNSSHLEWRADLLDTILKGTHPSTIPARFGLIWFRGFRGEDLNVKVYDVRRTPSDGKSSHGLWPGELKINKKNPHQTEA